MVSSGSRSKFFCTGRRSHTIELTELRRSRSIFGWPRGAPLRIDEPAFDPLRDEPERELAWRRLPCLRWARSMTCSAVIISLCAGNDRHGASATAAEVRRDQDAAATAAKVR